MRTDKAKNKALLLKGENEVEKEEIKTENIKETEGNQNVETDIVENGLLKDESSVENLAEKKATKLKFDEDKEIVAEKKKLSRKAKLVLEHIAFVLLIVVLSVVLTRMYYYSTQTDLDEYYVVGSYKVVSIEKIYPDGMDREKSDLKITKNKTTGLKLYTQEVVYNFGEDSAKMSEVFENYLLELRKPVNGFGFSEEKTENSAELCHQDKDVIKLKIEKSESKITITISYCTTLK